MNAGRTRTCALALALLIVIANLPMIGCINPLFFDDVGPNANHAPIVANMRPSPSFARLELNVGSNCGPLIDFFPDFIDDADLDRLSVRWTLLVDEGGFDGGLHRELRDEELEPLEQPIEGRFYVFRSFQITRETVQFAGVSISEQTDPNNPVEGQLLELTVSDRGFEPGSAATPPIPREGAGVVFMTWPVRLTDVPCDPAQ